MLFDWQASESRAKVISGYTEIRVFGQQLERVIDGVTVRISPLRSPRLDREKLNLAQIPAGTGGECDAELMGRHQDRAWPPGERVPVLPLSIVGGAGASTR